MKRIFILGLILLLLIDKYGIKFSHEICAESLISYQRNIDITDEQTQFEIKLKSNVGNNQRVVINMPNSITLKSDENEIVVSITLDKKYLYSKNDSIIVYLKHDKIIKPGEYEAKLKVEGKLETYKQEKIMYSSRQVTSWNYDDVSLDKPNGNYQEIKQYGYQEVSDFSNDNYVLEMPSDGFYKEAKQYGYMERSKTVTSVPYQSTYERHYNAYGSCPLDCVQGTVNDYKTGCSCIIIEGKTEYRDEITYGEWITNEDSWKSEAYQESDTIKPIERTIYYLPSSFKEASGFRYDTPYEKTNTVKPVERIVYIKPSSYSPSSNWTDTELYNSQDTIVETKKVCRILNNQGWSNWSDCN